MAERRMFAKTIIDSDAFLDMPLSTQALYFHLSMRADDEGFINNPKKIQRVIGGADDDLKLLIGKNFVIPFESGIVVIKHWKIHNYIRKDRLQKTVYQDEKACLTEKDNGVYTIDLSPCQSLDGQVVDKCQHRLGKDRLGKVSIGKDSAGEKEPALPSKENKQKKKEPVVYDADELLNQAILDFIDFRKKIRATMTDRAITLMINKLNKMTNNNDAKIEILEQSIMNGWKSVYPLKDNKKDKQKPSNNKFNDFEQRNYSKEDFKDLEKKLLNKGSEK